MCVFRVATFLLIAACFLSSQVSDAQPQDQPSAETTTGSPTATTEKLPDLNGNLVVEITKNITEDTHDSPSSASAVISGNSTELNGGTDEFGGSNSSQSRQIVNVTSNEFKPFLLFPTFPFLFPRKEGDGNGEGLTSEKSEEPKPFLFFKFSVNIRESPLNVSDTLNDSKIINVKNLDSILESPGRESQKNDVDAAGRKRRNANGKGKQSSDFFDDFPLFSDGDIDDFFPKPDFFFPDLLFHRKPVRKLSRKKRDMKKTGLKNDLKFFMDLFDEAFAKTKRDLEQANPILDFLRAGNEVNRKTDSDAWKGSKVDGFSGKKPTLARRTLDNGEEKLSTGLSTVVREEQNPVVFVDKIVKISEMKLPESHDEKFKSKKKKKRDANDSRKRHRRNNEGNGNETGTHQERNSKHIKHDRSKETSKVNLYQDSTLKEIKKIQEKIQLDEGEVGGNVTTRDLVPGSINVTQSHDKVDPGKGSVVHLIRKVVNSTENILNFAGDLIKVMDSLESKFKDKLGEKIYEKRRSGHGSGGESQEISYADVEKNITRILNEFIMFFNNLDSVKFDLNDVNSFDWTENETLISPNNLFEKRSKKNSDFTVEYVDREKKEKQVTDLNFLFLTVTLPTIIISALLLLVCFFSLQVRGKFCTKLFKPRRVLVIEDETPSPSPLPPHQENKKTDNVKTVREF